MFCGGTAISQPPLHATEAVRWKKPVFVVIDNARIHHNIPQEILDRWMALHCACLFYLPVYSPELNLIEIVWNKAKYHWRRFVTWTKESFEAELHDLLGGYGSKFQVNLS